MDDDPYEAECTNESCKNVKLNLKMLMKTTQKQAADLDEYSKIKAEADILRMKLVSVEQLAQRATENIMEAVNGKEIAEAALKQAQSMEKLYKERSEKFEEQAEDSQKHMQQASSWRDKYDSMCHLVERLEGNNIEVKAKYESAVQLAKVLGRQLKTQQSQAANLKTANNDSQTHQKNLNKYLKSAIQVIDALSTTSNLSKQPPAIKNLVTVFRRDDIRLFFNAAPWKNSDSSGAASTSEALPEAEDNEDDDAQSPQTVKAPPKPKKPLVDVMRGPQTLSDSDDEDPEEEIEDMERELTRAVKASVTTRSNAPRAARPHFEPLMVKLRNVRGAPRIVETKNVTNWPETIQKPITGGVQANKPRGVLDTRKIHQRHIVTNQFDAIAEATERRKETLLGAGSSDPTASGTTIHGRKGKTVRELQTEMMKGESVKEKVARMKAEASGQKSQEPPAESSKPVVPILRTTPSMFTDLPGEPEMNFSDVEPEFEDDPDTPATPPRKAPSVTRTKSLRHRLSESDSDPDSDPDSGEEYDPKSPGRSRIGRSKSATSTSSSVRRRGRPSNTPKKQPSVTLRRSSRISSRPQSRAPSRRASPARINPLPTQQDLIKQAAARTKRAQKRSSMRDDKDDSDEEEKVQKKKTPVMKPRSRSQSESPGEEADKELRRATGRQSLKERSAVEMQRRKEDRKRAAPAPLDAGPPARVKTIMGMQAPKKKEKTDEAPEVKKAPEVQPKEPEEPEEGPSTSTAPPTRISHQPNLVSEISPDFSVLMDREHSTSTPDLQKCAPKTLEDLNLSEDSVDDKQDDPDTSHEDLIYKPRPPLKVIVSETSEASSEDQPLQMDEVMDEEPAPIFEMPAPEFAPEAVEETVKPLEIVEPAPEVAPEEPPKPSEDVVAPEVAAKALEVTPEAVTTPEVTPKDPEVIQKLSAPKASEVVEKPSEPIAAAPEVVETTSKPSEEAPEVVKTPTKPVVAAPEVAPKAPEVVTNKPSEPIVATPEKKTPPVPIPSSRPPPLRPTLSDLCAPPPPSARTSTAPKSPKQIIACQFGLDISDSEEEEEEEVPEKTPEVQKSAEMDSDDEESLRIQEDDEVPSTSRRSATPVKKVPVTPVEVPEAPKSATPIKKVVEKPPTKASDPPKIIPPPEKKPIVVITAPKKDPVLKPRKPATMAPPPRLIPTPSPMSSSQNDDDLSLDILAGAKVHKPPVKKPAVKRPAREVEDTPSTSDAPSEPVPKKKPVPSLQRAKSVRDVKNKVQPEVVRSTSVKEPEEPEKPETEEPPEDNTPTTSTKNRGAILIESRPRGRPRKDASKPIGLKEAVQKAGEASTKKTSKALSTARGHLRQALDLKVELNELKRPLEEKGIVLGDSIPLPAADAAEVMIEFLRETSAGDMWAVMKKQRSDGNLGPLVNKEEENFLQVSVTLISEDQLLLEQFIEKTLVELCLRTSLDSKQCGRYTRIFCHAVRFVQKEDDEKTEWLRRFVFVLLHQHEHQLIKAIAYCLISGISEYFQWLVEDIDESTAFATVFKVLMHADPDQAAVVNWLLNSKFQMAIIARPTSEDIKKVFCEVHRKFIKSQDDVTFESLKPSIYLAKTGFSGILEVTFDLLQARMTHLEKQFLEPHEKDKEIKHKSVFTVSTVLTKMTTEEALEMKRELEWQKYMLTVMIDDAVAKNHCKAIFEALRKISPQIVTLREIFETSAPEQFAETSAIEPLRSAVDFLAQLISEFTNYPLKSTVLAVPQVVAETDTPS